MSERRYWMFILLLAGLGTVLVCFVCPVAP
jgi:hypothetical protein